MCKISVLRALQHAAQPECHVRATSEWEHSAEQLSAQLRCSDETCHAQARRAHIFLNTARQTPPPPAAEVCQAHTRALPRQHTPQSLHSHRRLKCARPSHSGHACPTNAGPLALACRAGAPNCWCNSARARRRASFRPTTFFRESQSTGAWKTQDVLSACSRLQGRPSLRIRTPPKKKKQDTIRVKPPSLCGHSGEGVKLSNRRLDSQSSFGFAEASFWKIISCIRVPNAVLELLLVGPRYGWTWVQDRESKPRPDRNQRRSLECVWDTTFLRSCETLDRLV